MQLLLLLMSVGHMKNVNKCAGLNDSKASVANNTINRSPCRGRYTLYVYPEMRPLPFPIVQLALLLNDGEHEIFIG